jgi:hypothetical protein
MTSILPSCKWRVLGEAADDSVVPMIEQACSHRLTQATVILPPDAKDPRARYNHACQRSADFVWRRRGCAGAGSD